MSVYKSKRGESSVQFIETARQLEAHTFACCMKAPKRYERFLTGRIMELSSEVHDRVRAANNIWPTNRHEAQLRRDELMRANNALQNLSPKLQLLYDSILQNPEGYGWVHKAMQRWGDLICEEAKLIAAVKKNDRQRYKDLPAMDGGRQNDRGRHPHGIRELARTHAAGQQLPGAAADGQVLQTTDGKRSVKACTRSERTAA